MNELKVLVQRLDPEARIPDLENPGDGGAVLRSNVAVRVLPGACVSVGTGLAVAIPDCYAGFVFPAMAGAPNDPVPYVVEPAVIDAGFRGELSVTVHNPHSGESEQINPGDGLARLVIMPVARAKFVEAERLPGSARGAGVGG
jgi:dUTP pyrophosphatase